MCLAQGAYFERHYSCRVIASPVEPKLDRSCCSSPVTAAHSASEMTEVLWNWDGGILETAADESTLPFAALFLAAFAARSGAIGPLTRHRTQARSSHRRLTVESQECPTAPSRASQRLVALGAAPGL